MVGAFDPGIMTLKVKIVFSLVTYSHHLASA